MKEYVKNMKKYEEIYVNILDLALPYRYRPWDLEKFREMSSYSLWDLKKFNPEFSLFIRALGLGKIPRPSFLLSSETWKNFDLHP